MKHSGEQGSWKALNVLYSRTSDRERWTTLYSVKHSVREGRPQGKPKGQPKGDAIKSRTQKRWVEERIDWMRKHEEDYNSANHNNRNLTPLLKQFRSDEMGTTWKSCSHLCFRSKQRILASDSKFFIISYPAKVRRLSPIYFEPDLKRWKRVLYLFSLHSLCRCVPY